MIIFPILYLVGTSLAGLSSVRFGASVAFGAKLLDDKVTLGKNERERRIGVNSSKSTEDSWVVLSFEASELPPKLSHMVGGHWLTVSEREGLLLAMDRVASGHDSSFDWAMFHSTQAERKKDSVLRAALAG